MKTERDREHVASVKLLAISEHEPNSVIEVGSSIESSRFFPNIHFFVDRVHVRVVKGPTTPRNRENTAPDYSSR